ncbi:hypothetical protein T4E_5049 [Trichinella pseudospiralis]|uniref:Uncharacterized protein n=1 Tax=Trichinella pseudospiralis TaxID=6337 RepID=A0A0V0Y4A5_TRIPS|nr:hypothetical protein T4E_5049 [Trichinella pseudospiralis]
MIEKLTIDETEWKKPTKGETPLWASGHWFGLGFFCSFFYPQFGFFTIGAGRLSGQALFVHWTGAAADRRGQRVQTGANCRRPVGLNRSIAIGADADAPAHPVVPFDGESFSSLKKHHKLKLKAEEESAAVTS